LLKVVAIFGVVLIHGAHLLVPETDTRSAVQDMARFAVPTFILVWAYFFELGYSRAGRRAAYARRRFVGLLVPYAFWTVLYVVILFARGQPMALADFKTGYWTGYGWPGQYYFIILFQLIIVFAVLRRAANGPSVILIVVTAFALYAFAPQSASLAKLSDRIFIYWIPFVAIGVWLARSSWGLRGAPRPALAGLGFASMILVPLTSAPSQSFSPYILPAVLATGIVMPLAVLLARPRGNGALNLLVTGIAKRTLGIFCVNPLVIMSVSAFTPPLASYGPVADVVLSLLAAAVVLALSVGVAFAVSATPLRRVVDG
jgi:surface polysaccharide O-acyltransferase-like enzyme